jgi:serine/threonine protein phosphatase PrpC
MTGWRGDEVSMPWRVAGISSAGPSHIKADEPCQDAHAVNSLGEWLIGVVSDGAGSAPNSAEAAHLICNVLINELTEIISGNTAPALEVLRNDDLIVATIDILRERVAALAHEKGEPLEKFDATIIGVLANSEGGVFFHIGDGAGCAFSSSDAQINVLTYPENGEYPNQTYFLTEASYRSHLRVTHFGPECDAIILMTDGVTPFGLRSEKPGLRIEFLAPIAEYLRYHTREETESALADQLKRNQITKVNDDKTLLCMVREDY